MILFRMNPLGDETYIPEIIHTSIIRKTIDKIDAQAFVLGNTFKRFIILPAKRWYSFYDLLESCRDSVPFSDCSYMIKGRKK